MNGKLSKNAWKSWQAYRLKVDETTKFRIKALSERARHLFRAYREACEETARLLAKRLKKEILNVMYQPGDGIVVGVENLEYEVPLNIPIEQFLEG